MRGEIDGLSRDLPALVLQLHHRTHRTRRKNAPLAIRNAGDGLRFAIHQRAHRADAERLIHLEHVAAHRRFQVVDVLGPREHFQVEAGTPLAEHIDGVTFVEINAPGGEIGLPAEAFIACSEARGRARWIGRAQPENGGLIAIRYGDDARLARRERNLKYQLVEFAVAIQVVRLGG